MAIRDNLRKKIVVSGGGGSSGGGSDSGTGGSGTSAIDGGYTVNFHNLDGVLIESHSALFGNWIDKPISYVPANWINDNGYVNQFPLTVAEGEGTVFNLYASETQTYAEKLYEAYGVDVAEYPYVAVLVYNSAYYVTLVFYKTASQQGYDSANFNDVLVARDCVITSSNDLYLVVSDLLNNLYTLTQKTTEVMTVTQFKVSANTSDIPNCTNIESLNALYGS